MVRGVAQIVLEHNSVSAAVVRIFDGEKILGILGFGSRHRGGRTRRRKKHEGGAAESSGKDGGGRETHDLRGLGVIFRYEALVSEGLATTRARATDSCVRGCLAVCVGLSRCETLFSRSIVGAETA